MITLLPPKWTRFRDRAAILLLTSSFYASACWAAPTSYRDAVQASAPWAYYRLGEPGGAVVAEVSDSTLNGTYLGGPVLGIAGSGAGDTSAAFNGSNQAVRLDNFAVFGSKLAAFSFECVLKTTSAAQGCLLGQTNTGSATAVSLQFNTGSSGSASAGSTRFFLRAENGTSYGAAFVNSALYSGNYVHLLLSFERATGLKVFVNGVQQTLSIATNSITSSSSFAGFTHPIHIAALNNRGSISNYAAVTIDEVAFYDSALPASVASSHYAALSSAAAPVLDLTNAHDFAVPANVTADAAGQLSGAATVSAFRAGASANRFVYSFETWPEPAANLGSNSYTFKFDLDADGAADQKVTFTNIANFPVGSPLTKATAGAATSSPSNAVGGLGDVGWTGSGRSEQTLSFSTPVSAAGIVYRSASALKLLKIGGADGPNYPVRYTLSDGTVVNLGSVGVLGATLSGGTNTFVGVIDSSGKGIVSLSIWVTGSVSGAGQSFTVDDLAFSIIPEPATANPIVLKSARDFRSVSSIPSNASDQLAGLSSLANFRALSGINRYVYSFNTWPQSAAGLGSNSYAFQFDLDANNSSDQSVTITSSSSAALTRTTLGASAASPSNVLGGLGDIGGSSGSVAHTYTFQQPVSAAGLVLSSPSTCKLQGSGNYPVSYTLVDGSVVNLGSNGALGATISPTTNTFVGVIDSSGKGISSITVRIKGAGTAGAQNVYVDDLAFVMAGPPPGAWTLTFNENFDQALNPLIWSTGPRWTGIINGELQGYLPGNVSSGSGLCTITIRKEQCHNTNMDGHQLGGPASAYSSGMIQTYNKWKQTYGYFESRIRMATGKGTWPAFWLLPDRGPSINEYYRTTVGDTWVRASDGASGPCPMGNEIDIMEYMATWKNQSTGLSMSHSGYIWGPSGSGKSYGDFGLADNGNGPARFYYDSPDTKFHTYGVYWGPGQLIYYIDGHVVMKRTDPATVSVVPEYLILNCAVHQNDWIGTNISTADIDAGLPCSMEIDYVRVWSGTLTP